jgi:hypothetical protein
MPANTISPFEYASILISIILGLGITQILSSVSDLLYDLKKVKFYFPHTVWVIFVLFLHIQEWFVIYELKNKVGWTLPELSFILLYPIILFTTAKMLLPTNHQEERFDLKVFFNSQFPIISRLIAICIMLSLLFNFFLLKLTFTQQIPLIFFFGITLFVSIKKEQNEFIHKIIAFLILIATLVSIALENDIWIIK